MQIRSPAGLEQTHKSINTNRGGIKGGSDHYRMRLVQQQNTAELGNMQKTQQNSSFLTFTLFPLNFFLLYFR